MVFSLALLWALTARQPFFDRTHPSEVFGQDRNYRIFLPADYETSGKTYPVIYYFHGHSDRYTLEKYDNGKDTAPKIAAWVAGHDAIVVSVDGYVARDYTGFYGGSPWDVRKEGGDYDFGLYFQELVRHIDSAWRTWTSRRFRATSGLSMGGFMSLWLSARYPDLIGSASSFNPGPEFFAGEKGRRLLWRPKDHVANHGQTMIRLIRASGDYISQYHEETREAYARSEVDFEYRRDEYHRHWATSIGETFDFHARAFNTPALDNVPEVWSYTTPYDVSEVRGYRIEAERGAASYVSLEGVRQGGMRVLTRRWAPDGPAVPARSVTVRTAPLYSAGASYTILDCDLTTGKTARRQARADAGGRLTIAVDGAGRQLGIAGPGTGAQPPVLLPMRVRFKPGREALPVRIFNPRGEAMTGVKVAVSSEYPTVRIDSPEATLDRIEPGGVADLSGRFQAQFTAGAGYLTPARLDVRIGYDGWYSATERVEIAIEPEIIPRAEAVEILDGKTITLNVFHQKGNQGGGAPVARTVTEGKGNGNGILEPGEEATLWVRMPQGMDPFDKNNWYRARVYSDSRHVTEIDLIEETKQREWTGAMYRTSVIRMAAGAPRGEAVPLLLENESWSFHWTPGVRYGPEPLYQAFQLHTRHLHRYELRTAASSAGRKSR